MDRLFGIAPPKRQHRTHDVETLSGSERTPHDVYRQMRDWRRQNHQPRNNDGTSDANQSNHTTRDDAECHVAVTPLPGDHHSLRFPGPGVPYEFRGVEPPHANVPRSVGVAQHGWEAFLKSSLGRPASGLFTNFFQAQDDYDYYQDHQPDISAPLHKSVLGLSVLSPYSQRYHLWTILTNVLDATYTAFLIPIIVAFIARSSDAVRDFATILEIVFGCVFLLDIFVNLHVGFVLQYDYKRKVVMDGKHILWYYLKYGGAWIDILSVIPLFYEIYVLIFLGFGNQSDDVSVLRLFRLLRIYRILKKIYGSSFAGTSGRFLGFKIPPAAVYLASVIYSMLVMMNFLGCLLFYIADWESEDLSGTWVSKYVAATNDLPETNAAEFVIELIANHTQPELYLTSLYWAVTTVTTVGYGDITPNSFTEMIALIFVMLSHIMLFGLLIGSISELVKSSMKSVQFQEETKKKVDSIGKWMKYRRLHPSIVRKINSYYMEIQRQKTAFDEEEILEELPLSLRIEVIYRVTKDLMKRLKVFSGIQELTLKKVAGRLIPVTLPPGHELLRQGDEADALYILETGQMAVLFNEVVVYYIEGPETCAETGVLSEFIPQLTLCSKDLAAVFAMDTKLRDALCEGYRQRLLKSFQMGMRTHGLEKKVEAEFGCKISHIQAVQLRTLLERARVHDGTFRQLVEDVISGKFAEESSGRLSRFRLDATSQESLPEWQDGLGSRLFTAGSERTPEEVQNLQEILNRIRRTGEFGMIQFVSHLKRVAGSNGTLDLDGLKKVSDGLSTPLNARVLLLLFSLFDPLETDRINVFTLIDEFRDLADFSTRQSHIRELFHTLDDQEKIGVRGDGILSLADLVRRLKIENHPLIRSGSSSTMTVLNEVLTAIGHEDITLRNFMNFHKDLSLCVEDDERFVELTNSLWVQVDPAELKE